MPSICPAWRAFNRAVGSNGSVGIWHETYLVGPGNYEVLLRNMPPFRPGRGRPARTRGGRQAVGRRTPQLTHRRRAERVVGRSALHHRRRRTDASHRSGISRPTSADRHHPRRSRLPPRHARRLAARSRRRFRHSTRRSAPRRAVRQLLAPDATIAENGDMVCVPTTPPVRRHRAPADDRSRRAPCTGRNRLGQAASTSSGTFREAPAGRRRARC